MQFSVVIPIKDEEENLVELVEEIEPVMEGLGKPWELICVDDGSEDKSLALLSDLAKHKPYLRVLSFSQNFGQSSAFAAGFSAARAPFVITLDADRQNNPQDIPKMVEQIDSYDLIVGWRKDRKDPWKKRWISKLSNAVRRRLCKDGVHDTGCSLKIYRKSALEKIKLYHGMHRFLPALFRIEGFAVHEMIVSHRRRTKGSTKYHFFNRSLSPLLDMLAVFWMRKRALKHKIVEEIPHEHR